MGYDLKKFYSDIVDLVLSELVSYDGETGVYSPQSRDQILALVEDQGSDWLRMTSEWKNRE